jgi:hypothetical protein
LELLLVVIKFWVALKFKGNSGVFRDVAPCGSHGVTSQKTPFFIVTAVKTSNLTKGNISFITSEVLS